MNISIKGLNKSFGKLVLFNDFNVEISGNKITCIHGVSGCGKTTLLDIIGLIEPYQSGIITYDGKEIKKESDKRKMLQNEIGFIFQDFGLIENETVKDNMFIVKKIRKMKNAESQITKTLENLQLPIHLNRKIYELSGGEQQRLAIAKIILKDPNLILADEPTASVDAENKQIILNLLRQLANQGKTVIIVTHDQEVKNFADEQIDLSALRRGIQ